MSWSMAKSPCREAGKASLNALKFAPPISKAPSDDGPALRWRNDRRHRFAYRGDRRRRGLVVRPRDCGFVARPITRRLDRAASRRRRAILPFRAVPGPTSVRGLVRLRWSDLSCRGARLLADDARQSDGQAISLALRPQRTVNLARDRAGSRAREVIASPQRC